MSKIQNTKYKVAILHAFFKSNCKGGGEKLIFAMRDYYKADLYAGAIDLENWNPNQKSDSFVQALWNPNYSFKYLHHESQIPFWSKVKRQLHFMFSPIINELDNYDIVFFSGNIALAQGRIKHPKKILYCHTTPRPFTDQLESSLAQKFFLVRPFVRLFAKWVVWQYRQDCLHIDLIISNSTNIQNRLKTYIGIDSKVIYPAVDTKKFEWIDQGDYFISYARLESIKRIELIVEAFAQMPNQKITFCSTGPLQNWLRKSILDRGLTNIRFEGLVSDEHLAELVGKSRAGIYIPINEDAGITQIEIMAAGKPVIGVDEGALPDTVIDNKTGIIIPADPTVEDLKLAIQKMTPELATSMRETCTVHAKTYDQSVFFDKINIEINGLFDKSTDLKQ